MKRYQLRIDGQSADPAGANWFETQNPYTGQAWAEMTATQRALMRKLGDLIARDAAKLATTDVRDNGKRSHRPSHNAKAHVPPGQRHSCGCCG